MFFKFQRIATSYKGIFFRILAIQPASIVCGTVILAMFLLPIRLLAGGSKASVQAFTLPQAVQYATDHYPEVRVAIERETEARARVSVARSSYLPHADIMLQLNRATRNNVAGVLLPQSTIPNPSGPVLDSSMQSFWGSGAGAQAYWEPFDFGYRHAVVQSAQATLQRTRAQTKLTLLDIQTAAADAVLSVVAAEQQVNAMQADVERRSVLARSVHALVDAQLRPGADDSHAKAELAAAQTGLILAEENVAVAKANLAQLLGIAGTEVEVIPGPLLRLPKDFSTPDTLPATHPQAIAEQARVLEAQARIHILNTSYVPTFKLEGVGYGRGSGAMGNGKASSDSTQGLLPDTPNWAAGVAMKFALFDFASLHYQKKIARARQRETEASYALTLQQLLGQSAKAKAILDGAERAAQNTPLELQASQDAEQQASARFKAGLATVVDVAEAQRLLVGAEIDDSLARLSIWRALERLSSAQGDLKPFIDLVNQADTMQATGGN